MNSNELLAEAQVRFNQLSPRERHMVTFLAVTVIGFVLFFSIFSLSNHADSTRRRTTEKLLKLEEAKLLAANYSEAEASRRQAEERLSSNDLRLMTFLSEKGTESGLDIPALNPRGDVPLGDGKIIESSVVLDFTDISLPKLVTFLHKVEASAGVVKVKYLRLEPRPADEKLSASVTVSSYRLKP
jgi:general secretion pathway protein M